MADGAQRLPGAVNPEPLPLDSDPDREYDEIAFLYFLGVERSRANRSNQTLGLLLVTVEPDRSKPITVQRSTANRLFDALRRTLRETDVVGWYLQDRVAGAILPARSGAPGAEMSRVVRKRVAEQLGRRLPPSVMHNVQVRVIELRRPVGRQ